MIPQILKENKMNMKNIMQEKVKGNYNFLNFVIKEKKLSYYNYIWLLKVIVLIFIKKIKKIDWNSSKLILSSI